MRASWGNLARVGELTERVETTIRKMIERGDYGPGDRLPSERQLAAELSAGRTTIRQVLSKLATLGLIEARHGSGYFVTRQKEAEVADTWYTGNANTDKDSNRGWLLGHFIEPGQSVCSTNALEVKWGIHPAGDKRAEWTTDERRTTMVILISGRFRVDLSVGKVLMESQGDYGVWGPGIDHSWEALEDSVVLTVRWPSIVG